MSEGSTDRGPVAQQIEMQLSASFELSHLEVINESDGHNVPPGSETHFKVVLVSDGFADSSRIARHRAVNRSLAEPLAGPVHALSIHAYSEAEWAQRFGNAPKSPPCLGGSKADRPES
ncbi:MAG: BolA/IbaG family iron-sulfur metabolism protein [Pseudomonadota bacterium]